MRRLVAGLLLLVVLVVGYLAATRGPSLSSPSKGTEREPMRPAVETQQAELEVESKADAVRSDASQCLLLDAAGEPVVGACVLLYPSDVALFAQGPTWPRIDWSALDASVHRMWSDAEGRIDRRLLDTRAWAGAWIVHPRHEARSIPASGIGAQEFPRRIVLDPAPAWSAHVTDAHGSAVPDARVIQLFDLRSSGRTGSFEPAGAPTDSRRWLRLETRTDDAGRAQLQPLPGRSWVWCQHGALRSPAWFGSQPAAVELVLSSSFTLSGRIVGEQAVIEGRRLAVRWLARRGSSTEWIDTLDVRGDGSIGPLAAPRVSADKYLFQLVGEGIAFDQVEAFVPAEGSELAFQLEAIAGLSMRVRVLDAEALPVAEARVLTTWSDEGHWQSVERLTDSEGLARFTELAPTVGYVQVRSAGFVPYTSSELDLRALADTVHEVRLAPGGTIEGRVLHAGHGVSDFTLYFWQGEHENMSRHVVHGAEDGRFVLDMAALGENSLMATSDDLPTSDAVTVQVTREAPAKAELVLPEHVVGRGRLVDARTLEPVPGATAQPWISHGRQTVRLWGAPVTADSSGSFELRGLRAGTNLVQFAAPGYATLGLHLQIPPGEQEHEFGGIALVAKSRVVLRLTGIDAGNYVGFSGGLLGPAEYSERPFSAGGELSIEDVDPGAYTVTVTCPDRALISQLLVVNGGERSIVVVPVAGRALTVQVEFDASHPWSPGLQLQTAHATQQGRDMQHDHLVPESGRVEVPRVEGPFVMLTLFDAERTMLAAKEVRLGADGPREVTLRASDRERTLRVVDREKNPLQGVTVFVSHPEVGTGWQATLVTDAAGECTLRGVALPRVLATLYSPSLGMRPGVMLELESSGDRAIELVLDPKLELAVQVLEGATPLRWIQLRATDSSGVVLGLSDQASDESGHARWPSVSPGRFLVEVRHPGLWTTSTTIDLVPGASPHPIQVRRLGELRMTSRTKLGSARANVPFALRSIDLDSDVTTWLEQGRIDVEGGALVTNADGVLVVRGLPVGEYAWRAADSEGAPISGRARVDAGRSTEVVLD